MNFGFVYLAVSCLALSNDRYWPGPGLRVHAREQSVAARWRRKEPRPSRILKLKGG